MNDRQRQINSTSGELHRRATKVLPGGVNSPVRAMRSIGRQPIFIDRAHGAEVIDVDGNTYVDYVCSWGPLILGHANERVVDAVKGAASTGTSFGAPTAAEVELAELVAARVPGAEMMRMTSSGTEAASGAVRLARAATGRSKLLKFAGAYHGHSDAMLVAAGSGAAAIGAPSSPGVTAGAVADTVVIEWNDAQSLRAACAEHEFAAVIAEPLPANMGLVAAEPGFLELLKQLTRQNGALLIFDEVISGFRVAGGGMQEQSGVEADLVVMGKILGGGLPAAAFAGNRELMSLVAPEGDVYQAGTLSGNPLATAAGLATIAQLDSAAYRQLATTTERLASGLQRAADASGQTVSVTHACGLLTVFFVTNPPKNFREARSTDLAKHAAWCRALLDRGVYAPPSQYEAWFPSLAHDDATVDHTIAIAEEAFAEVAANTPDQ